MPIDLQNSVNNFNSFYVELCNLMTRTIGTYNAGSQVIPDESMGEYQNNSSEMLRLKLETFRKSSAILTHIQQYQSADQISTMPDWLAAVIRCSKTPSAKIALVSTETFLSILSAPSSRSQDPIIKLQNLIVNQEDGLMVMGGGA